MTGSSSRRAGLVVSLVLAATAAQPRGAAGQSAPVAHENLKILPQDIPQPQLLQTMQALAQGLGVPCGYCHAPAPAVDGGRGAGGRGRGGPPALDFASDEKPAKRAAREMMLIVRDINARVPAAVVKGADATVRVGCATCHRGVAIPRLLPDILGDTVAARGTAAAIGQYKDLRKQYFGAQAYDFSETSLLTVAQRAATPADTIAWLRLNLDYFPFSSRTYAALAQAQQRQNDRNAALASLTRAVELDAQNAQIKAQLDQLRDGK